MKPITALLLFVALSLAFLAAFAVAADHSDLAGYALAGAVGAIVVERFESAN